MDNAVIVDGRVFGSTNISGFSAREDFEQDLGNSCGRLRPLHLTELQNFTPDFIVHTSKR
jgi:hypothetical protein